MRLCFPDWDLEGSRRELRVGSKIAPVEPLVFDLLFFLACHADRVVSKEELLDQVWGGTCVSHWAISRAVKEARRALRENGADARVLRTVRGHGYVLSGPLRREATQAPIAPAVPASSDRDAILDDLLDAPRSGEGGELVLLLGEPGIGKSWLASRLMARVRARGSVAVLGGASELGPRGSLDPWSQALRGLFQQGWVDASRIPPAGLRALRACLPGLADWLGDEGIAPASASAAQATFRLTGHLRALLAPVCDRTDLWVVLEDLQRADPASLDLLAALAEELHDLPVMIVGTARDTEWHRHTAQHRRLLSLAAHPRARVIEVRGLPPEVVRRIAQETCGRRLDGAEGEELARRTGGNPFLLLQLLRQPDAKVPDLPSARPVHSIPSLSREVLAHQLVAVSATCRALLTTAAVAGREFDLDVIREAVGELPDSVEKVVDEARRARLLVPVDARGRRFRFAHALVAECLVAEAPTGAVARAHETLAEILMRRGDSGDDSVAIAHHLVRAAVPGRVGDAVPRLRAAARELRSRQDFVQAAELLRAAIEILRQGPGGGPEAPDGTEVRIELGEALIDSGEVGLGRRELLVAADRARLAGNADALARAALAFAGREESAGVDPERLQLLEDAAACLAGRADEQAVRVWGRLALALQGEENAERRRELAAGALARAREIGDPGLLVDTLRAAHLAGWTPDNLEERTRLASEQLFVARSLGDVHRIHDAQMDLVADRIESGDLSGARALLRDHQQLAASSAELLVAWHQAHYDVMQAMADGQLDAAERGLVRASALGARVGYDLAEQWTGVQLFSLRRLQGRLGELAPLLAQRERETPLSGWRLAAALAAAEAGDPLPGRGVLAECLRDGELTLGRDYTWLISAALGLELSRRVGTAGEQRVFRESLAPYAGRHVSLYGMCDWGPVAGLIEAPSVG